ncbi:MAG: hypothetical protein ABI467_17465 [Kofleriaceae bacterium]
MHEIEGYGIGKSELATWRDARHATLLFAPRGETVTLTLLADDLLIGRHTVAATQFAEAIAGYSRYWQSGANAPGANVKERSYVTAYAAAGQGVDTGIPPHTPPKGYPAANVLVHAQLRAFVTIASER